jgi:hypothetical protein
MKYRRGKNNTPRRQRKAFCMKTGGGKFSFSGGRKMSPFGNPVPVGLTSNEQVKENLKRIGFRVGGGDR